MKKKIANSSPIPFFEESLEHMEPESRIFVDKSLAIAHYLQLLMRHRGLRQKDLADLLGKSEPEISKWLAGMHNYTLRTLSKLEAALQSDIVVVPEQFESPEITETASYSLTSRRRDQPSGAKELAYSKPAEVEGQDNASNSRQSLAA